MTNGKILLIGGSAGALELLMQVLPGLRSSLDLPIVIVIHRGSSPESVLSEVLGRKAALPVREIEDKDPVMPGVIHVAPGDYHLLFEADGTCSLDQSEKVNFSRPSLDVTFESAALRFGGRTVAILLSGASHDGVAGLVAIRKAGGIVCVQDPASAQVSYMPASALEALNPDQVLDPAGMIGFINRLT